MASTRKLSSVNLAGRVEEAISSLLPPGSSILLGLSGGVDSVVLLNLLHELAPRFSWQLAALHVHHGISPNADAWVDFCVALCASLNTPLCIERVDIAPLRAQGLEAAARQLRHEAFARQQCDFVALAHHADDQVETLLLQLLRGAGVRGASAMPVLSPVDEHVLSPVEGLRTGSSKVTENLDHAGRHQVIRPLLHSTRDEIIGYAKAHGLQWMEDESNADDTYPRNFLRHRLLPKLAEKFPAYRDTLSRSAQHFAEAGELLDDLAKLDAVNSLPRPEGERAEGEGGELHLGVATLQGLSLPRAKNLLRHYLYQLGALMPQSAQLDEMLHQLCGARDDAAVCIGFGAWQIRRYQGRIYALRTPGEFDRNFVLRWQGEAELYWPALGSCIRFLQSTGHGVSLEKLQRAPVTLRLRQGGEGLRPSSKASTRTLKNLLQEHRVPPWQRDRLPLLYCGEELVCVPGVAIAAEYQCKDGEAGVTLQLTS